MSPLGDEVHSLREVAERPLLQREAARAGVERLDDEPAIREPGVEE